MELMKGQIGKQVQYCKEIVISEKNNEGTNRNEHQKLAG